MLRLIKRAILVLCAVSSVVAALGHELISPHSARNRASAIECTLAWGRFARFPASAQQLTISTEGGMFTRAFRVSFVAPSADIEQWLRQSPGTREVLPETASPYTRHFDIAPGDGAAHAEVTIDDTAHSVSIYVYWS
jgi:hypothetical protein